ncbi:MAG: hypothetical protein K9K75_07060, partial [Deltaproteobacteria bacterium]|nr:hypothetical protein [Deltaproteobacteria bacterium]
EIGRQEYHDAEISITDLLVPIIKQKLLIIIVLLAAVLVALMYYWLAPASYRSEAIIESTIPEETSSISSMLRGEIHSSSLAKFKLVMESRALNVAIIEKHNLLPIIFKANWDETNKRWKTAPPTLEDAYLKLKSKLIVKTDKPRNVLVVTFEARTPAQAMGMLNIYLDELGNFLRNMELEERSEQIKTLEEQMLTTGDPVLRIKLLELMARHIDYKAFIMSRKHYGFRVLAPPFLPEKHFSPNLKKVLMVTMLGTFFLMILIIVVREFTAKFKSNNTEKFAELQQSFGIRDEVKGITTFIARYFRKN